jgi:hypothetical protein
MSETTTGELQRDIGRLEGKVDSLILQLTEHIKKDESAWSRVTALEKKIMWVSGAAAAIMFFVAPVLTKILQKIGLM